MIATEEFAQLTAASPFGNLSLATKNINFVIDAMPFPEWFGSGQDEALFLRRLLDHVSDCLVAVDTGGRVVFINSPYCKLLGGRQEDYIGRHITDVVSPQTRLHEVARGDGVVIGAPLEVKGHHLITRQVPVFQDGRIIGAVGMALFSNLETLKKAFTLAARSGLVIHNSKNSWVARHTIADIVGEGAQVERMRTRLRQAATHSLPVLIQGETGTGKELAANAIHNLSQRAGRPFVWVNCASIPEALIDAELFGYEGGAYTGARSSGKPGKFELADGGTLFLDEIGDMPMHLQASLLRALQNQEIVRVGGTAPIVVDTRIICATNRPLSRLVREGKFRADLFYRLNVLNIEMPRLRDRDDLELLIRELLERLAQREGIHSKELSRSDMQQLLRHSWPGNVRELEATLVRFLVSGDIVLTEQSLPEAEEHDATSDEAKDFNLQSHLARQTARQIQRALQAASQDKDEAARLLGISRATLYRELQRNGMTKST